MSTWLILASIVSIALLSCIAKEVRTCNLPLAIVETILASSRDAHHPPRLAARATPVLSCASHATPTSAAPRVTPTWQVRGIREMTARRATTPIFSSIATQEGAGNEMTTSKPRPGAIV